MRLKRPTPPAALRTPAGIESLFHPAPDVSDWLRDTFIIEGGPLANEDHIHLRQASLGVLWTNVPATSKMVPVVGTAEIAQPRGRPWIKQRQEAQIQSWGFEYSDFIITLYAPWMYQVDDNTFCAILEHELYHCAHATRDGFPWFLRSGRPKYAIKGHDVEEFIGVVRRYGAVGLNMQALAGALKKGPTVGEAKLVAACGTCGRRVVA